MFGFCSGKMARFADIPKAPNVDVIVMEMEGKV